ncbi:hypothetical protein WME99_25835 [Sorangium sp. So ce136]
MKVAAEDEARRESSQRAMAEAGAEFVELGYALSELNEFLRALGATL